MLVIFAGRDAAGKGGAIKRIRQYLNPRTAHVVALQVPSEREKGQWSALSSTPSRRWRDCSDSPVLDNRAGVEHVLGYCTADEYERFPRQVPFVERMLVEDGVIPVKYWFSVSDGE